MNRRAARALALALACIPHAACDDDREIGYFGGQAYVYMRVNKGVPGDAAWYTTGACRRKGVSGEGCDFTKAWGVWVETARLDAQGCIVDWVDGDKIKCTGFKKWSVSGPEGMLDGQRGPWSGMPPLP